jgi:uncharacterized membrane protein YfcA
LTGFLGVGGGFLIQAALMLFAGLDMKPAIGTSLSVITVNCLVGLLGQLASIDLNWRASVGFLAAALVGMAAGWALSNRFPSQSLRRGFAWSIIGLGAFVIVKSLLGKQFV